MADNTTLAALLARLAQLENQLESPTPDPLSPPPPPLPPPPPSPPPPEASSSLILIVVLAAVCGLLVITLGAVAAFVYRRQLPWGLAEFCETFSKSWGILQEEGGLPSAEEEEAGRRQAETPAGAPAAADDDQQRRDQSEKNRELLRDRIKAATTEERQKLARREAEALDNLADSVEASEAAEAAVAAAGSPGAALLAAITRGASAVEVRALLLRGANPDAAFLDRGALAVAARTCEPGVIKVLLEAGATLDMKDGRGWTPLMHAIEAHNTHYSREAVLTLLLDAGAAVDVWGNDLKGPMDLLNAAKAKNGHSRRFLGGRSSTDNVVVGRKGSVSMA